MNVYDLWCDGANGGKNGTVGGWAAILIDQSGSTMAISGHDPSTSSNRMELTAVVRGLEAIGSEQAIVTIFVDSSYTKGGFTRGWIKQWEKNGWIGSRGDPVANQDLWRELIVLTDLHFVKWRKVRGHSTSKFNNLADAMAVAAKKTGVGVVEFL